MARSSRDAGGREWFKYAGLGFEFAGVVGVSFYIGYLADNHWDCAPRGLLIGGGIGLIGGVYHLIKEGNKMMRTLDSGTSASRDEPDDTERTD
jgi:F0F1-type ATP synthase assembly protein I